jgi:hypothetical protein
LVILIGLWLGVGGCTSRVYGNPALVSGTVPSAELVVLRKKEFAASANALLVKLDGEKLVRLRTGRYAEFRIQPGVYQLTMANPGRLPFAPFDPLRLDAGTRTYVILGKQSESWGYSTHAEYCLAGSCPQTSQPSTSISVNFVFGFDLIPEKDAHALMDKYKRVEHE